MKYLMKYSMILSFNGALRPQKHYFYKPSVALVTLLEHQDLERPFDNEGC